MKLSICCITYNHEKYITEALDGFLMQDFDDYEIVVSDDCSTDNTRLILKGYEANYPGKVRLLLNEQNIGIMPNFIQALKGCRGEYIALCEGDDYWIDPLKLKKQVYFLEQNTEYALCAGYAHIHNENSNSTIPLSGDKVISKSLGLADILIQNTLPTLTVVFKNTYSYEELEKIFATSKIGDWPLYIHIGLKQGGKYFVMPEVFGVYRIHTGGVYSSLKRKESFINIFYTLGLIDRLTEKNYNYLFLINTLVYLEHREEKRDALNLIVEEVQGSTLEQDIKERLVIYIQSGREVPAKILKSAIKPKDYLAVSGFLAAHAYHTSGGNFIWFTRKLNRILKAVSDLHIEEETLIYDFVCNRWFALYVFFDYDFTDLLLTYFNKNLFKNKITFGDWLYTNKEKFPVLTTLSSITKKLANSKKWLSVQMPGSSLKHRTI